MNGNGQIYMNVGITATFGAYGVGSALYSEAVRPQYEWRGTVVAVDLLVSLILFAVAGQMFKLAYHQTKDDREFDE